MWPFKSKPQPRILPRPEQRRKPVEWPVFEQPAGAANTASDGLTTAGLKHHHINGGLVSEFFARGAHPLSHYECAALGSNWLIDRACRVPARDAVRNGYKLNEEADGLRKTDERYDIVRKLREFVHFGRLYGGYAAIIDVQKDNPEQWYSNPFNLDGIAPGEYKGITLVDPNWITPQLTNANTTDPVTQDFYEPTYWKVGTRTIHKSHIFFCVPNPVPDLLKPTYGYMGYSVPQMIADRVYGAERSANEAAMLLATMRYNVLKIADADLKDMSRMEQNLSRWVKLVNNYGVKVLGDEDEFQQFATSLSGVDDVTNEQYALVAAACGVPVTKLMGTPPKGMNATGEHDAENYRHDLKGIQTNELQPLLTRHYECVAKSQGQPMQIDVVWEPTDTPTAKEQADIEKTKAERDTALFNTGAIDAEDIRERVRTYEAGDYFGIEAGELETNNVQTFNR